MSGDPDMTSIGDRMISGPSAHYGPKIRQRFDDWASQYGGSTTDAGTQVRYIENTMSWKAVSVDVLTKCIDRYARRFGTRAGVNMANYFNPQRVPLSKLSQTVIDLWYFTIVGDLIQRGGYRAP